MNLTLDELYLLLDASYEEAYNRRKFDAALQGVDLEDEEEAEPSSFDEIRARADEILKEQGQDTRDVTQREIDDLFGFDDDDD